MRRKVKSRGKGRKPAPKKTTKAKAKQSQTVRVNVVQTVGAPGDAPPPPPPFQKGWSTYDIVRPMTPAHMPPVNTGTPLSHKVGANILGGDEAMSEVARSESARPSDPLATADATGFSSAADAADATSMLPFIEGGDMVDLSNMTYAQLLEFAGRKNISLSRSVRKNKASLLLHISKMLGR